MKRVFADAGYWIALFNPHDQLHIKAVAAARQHSKSIIVTSQVVLTEFLNHYASHGVHFRAAAVQVIEALRHDVNVLVAEQTSELFEKALALYTERPDKAWGLSDCSSFVVMQEQGITEALAYDEHFQQAGFKAGPSPV